MLNKTLPLGQFFDLEHTVLGSALVSSAGLWLLLAAAARYLLNQPTSTAIALGFSATILHWTGELWHQLGHARAARKQAAPMQGIRYWWVLGSSVYPENEPDLSPRVHIRRALGGPIASLTLVTFTGLLLLLIRPTDSPAFLLIAFVFTESLLIYGLGSLLPLGFTDGSTLLKYWGKR